MSWFVSSEFSEDRLLDISKESDMEIVGFTCLLLLSFLWLCHSYIMYMSSSFFFFLPAALNGFFAHVR